MQNMPSMPYERKSFKRQYNNEQRGPVLSSIRVPPQHLDSERALLGALMIRADTLYEVSDLILPDAFYAEKHRIIYQAMLDLHNRREPIDLLTMSAKLSERGQFDQIGGHTYLTELTNAVPSSANARHYAEIIHRKHILRRLITGAEQVSELGFQEERPLEEILDEAESTIYNVTTAKQGHLIINMKDGANDAWERFSKLSEEEGGIRGVTSGFPSIDKLLSGFQPSDLIILAARPSMGKTSLALDIIRKAAVNHQIPVGMFSLEMSSQQLVDRMVSAESRIDAWKLRTGSKDLMKGDAIEYLREGIDRLSKAPIFINDQAGINIMNMRSTARRMVSEYGVKLIVVDYLQLMSPMHQSDSQVQIVTEISRSLKGLAKDLNVPVIALSQLSRAVEQRVGGKPKLSDLRDSGSIEQDADVVIFIHREQNENGQRNEVSEILIEKHRNGATGVVELHFDGKHTSFRELDNKHSGYSSNGGDPDDAFAGF